MATNDSSFAYSIDQAQRLFGKGLEVIGSRTGIESLFNYGKEVVAQQDKDIAEGNYQPEYTMGLREAYQQGGLSDAIGWVAEKTGENIATSGIALGGGLAAALTAPFSVPAAALIGGATIVGSGIVGTGEVASEMEEKTGSYNESVAIGAGTIIALLDRFGAGRVIPKDELLSITGKDLIKKLGAAGKVDAAREIGRRIGKSVAFEGGTEGLQEGVVVGSTALTGGEYTGEEIADRLLEGVVLGGTMGGGTTTAIEAFRQGPGIAGLIGDTLGPGGMTPSQQLAMQTAASSYSPAFAKFRAKDVPLTDAEILMNEAAGQTGSVSQIKQEILDLKEQRKAIPKGKENNDARTAIDKEIVSRQKIIRKELFNDHIEITDDTNPNIDEDQTFFNKDLEGSSVGNPSIQKIADEELKAIDDKLEQRRQSGESISPIRAKVERDKAKNRERFTDIDEPVVSPLRIKLIKLASEDKFGMKKPIKVSKVYDELRAQEDVREGSVGFLGRRKLTVTQGEEERWKPKDGKGEEFGRAVKAAPKKTIVIVDDKGEPVKDKKGNQKVRYEPDFTKIPDLDKIAFKFNVPIKVTREENVFDAPNQTGDLIIHNRGGEAFVSGLEEYLVRNKDTTKTMEEIIYDFDQMRPTVRLQVRSSLNRNMATSTPGSAPFTNFEIADGDVLQDPSLAAGTAEAQQLQSTQRIYESFATPTGKPINIEVPDNRDPDLINIERNRDPEVSPLGSGQIFEIDSISVVAVNPDQEKLKGGSLTNSPVIKAVQQKKNAAGNTIEAAEDAERKELNLPHDYYKKGFGYSRAMIVRGADNKLYAMLEELQSDVTRTYENLLDFAKPTYAYDTPVEYGGIPELFSGAIDMALKGNDPYLTKNAGSLGGTTFQDKRPIRTLGSTYGDFTGRDSRATYKILTPSERNKIRVLDSMDQDMPDNDAPSQFNQDLAARRKIFEDAEQKLKLAEEQAEKIDAQIKNFQTTKTAPMEISKIHNVTLDDLVYLKDDDFVKDVLRYFKAYARNKETTQVSARQRPDERLNKLESMIENILFTDTDYEKMADNFVAGLEAMDPFEGTQFGNDPRQTEMRNFDGFQMAQNNEFSLPAPDRLAGVISSMLERTDIKTPIKKNPTRSTDANYFNKQGRLSKKEMNLEGDENATYLRQLGYPKENKSLRELIFGHMPLRSNRQYLPGDDRSDLGIATSNSGETRALDKRGMLYESATIEGSNSISNDSQDMFQETLLKNLKEKGYSDAQLRDFFADSSEAFAEGAATELGFRGEISEQDLTDAGIKALESSLNRGIKESINEQALNVIKHELSSHLANKFKSELAAIDFDAIADNNIDSASGERYTDTNRFPETYMFEYSGIMADIQNILPEKVKVEAEKELSRLIDRMTDKIGFVPEDGNFAMYMQEINRRSAPEIGRQAVEKYSKQLGLNDKNALKKKLLIASMLKNEKIKPIVGEDAADVQIASSPTRSFLERFRQSLPTGALEDEFRKISRRLTPVPYDNHEYRADHFEFYTPDASNPYKLFFSQSYKGFLSGDKTRAEKIKKEKDKLDKEIPRLQQLVEDNKVGTDNNTEIDRRFKKLIEHAEKNAKDYNYKPEELKEAATRLFEHINDNKRYTRSPHNATMAQTSRGLLQSLIHKITDPRFEQLYGEPIVGIVVPHREDLWLPRANEDSSLRKIKKTFGLGTYDTTLLTVAKRFEDAGAEVDRDRIFEMLSKDSTKSAQLNRPAQFVINLEPGSKGRKLAEGKFTFRAKGGYIDLRRKAS